ncbi:LytR/AlgR family response regulator transcription factor [Anaerorhabdus furcosa]|uniref:Two component transcriptional regulator, LytTR family n=1 Tax=Anaerorhabdus furcosa TaxID=118967 RepID=A0A1T4Q531_9FIRM|nr:response regulator [Anaerorhabdus furcosa]SJZ98873.1 two component transcriptional regulator, LytTR family [Anaerorhabdus furcosa]
MIKIAIIDDDNLFISLCEEYFKNTDKYIIIPYSDSKLFCEEYFSNSFDVIFLDIEMPFFSGLEVHEFLKNNNSTCLIIFVSNQDKYILNCFDINVIGFIQKSKIHLQLPTALNKIENIFMHSTFTFQTKNEFINLSKNEICVIEVVNRKIELHTNNQIHILKNGKISTIYCLLNDDFFLINRSTIINMHKIISITGNQIFIKNIKKAFLLSKYRKKDFYSKYFSLIKARNL